MNLIFIQLYNKNITDDSKLYINRKLHFLLIVKSEYFAL